MADDIKAAGTLESSATVSPIKLDQTDMDAINRYALVELAPEDVFAFAVRAATVGENRNFTPFDSDTLRDLAELYPGTTVIKDHRRAADNQVGRIYAAELSEDATELILRAYMVRTSENAGFIAEVAGGIKSEVSVSFQTREAVCSICGTDNAREWCEHWPGEEYDVVEDGKHVVKTCEFLIHGADDVYELSFVAVPALRDARCVKASFEKPEHKQEHKQVDEPEQSCDNGDHADDHADELAARVKLMDAFAFVENNRNEG